METKPTNPKDAIGCDKIPLGLVPATAIAHQAMAHLDGALKYGAHNWRTAGVRASIYIDACKRHLDAWANGEETAKDSGVHHLGHAAACLNIILDAMECGKLVDDRPTPAPVAELHSRLNSHVKAMRAKAASPAPLRTGEPLRVECEFNPRPEFVRFRLASVECVPCGWKIDRDCASWETDSKLERCPVGCGRLLSLNFEIEPAAKPAAKPEGRTCANCGMRTPSGKLLWDGACKIARCPGCGYNRFTPEIADGNRN